MSVVCIDIIFFYSDLPVVDTSDSNVTLCFTPNATIIIAAAKIILFIVFISVYLILHILVANAHLDLRVYTIAEHGINPIY